VLELVQVRVPAQLELVRVQALELVRVQVLELVQALDPLRLQSWQSLRRLRRLRCQLHRFE
jgi:hypothetical protein